MTPAPEVAPASSSSPVLHLARFVAPLLESLGLDPRRVSGIVITPHTYTVRVAVVDVEGQLVVLAGEVQTTTITGECAQ